MMVLNMMAILKKDLEMERVFLKLKRDLDTVASGKIIDDMEMASKSMLMIVNMWESS